MKSKISSVQKIGTFFKKENIFIISYRVPTTKEECEEHFKSETGKDLPELVSKILKDAEEIACIGYGIVYKEDEGYYTLWGPEGPEMIVGDGSDGKFSIKDKVSAFKYFTEEQICEALVDDEDDGYMAILINTKEPFKLFVEENLLGYE